MKKVFVLIAISSLLSGCLLLNPVSLILESASESQTDSEELNHAVESFQCEFEYHPTSTDLFRLNWEPYDTIGVYSVREKSFAKYHADNKYRQQKASFFNNSNPFSSKDSVIATYPANPTLFTDSHEAHIILPDKQVPYAEKVDLSIYPCVSSDTLGGMTFHPIYSLIAFRISKDNIYEIVFSSKNNESIAGDFLCTLQKNGETVLSVPKEYYDKQSSVITLSPADGKYFKNNYNYVIPVKPVKLTGGGTFSFYMTRGDKTVKGVSIIDPLDLKRGYCSSFRFLFKENYKETVIASTNSPKTSVTYTTTDGKPFDFSMYDHVMTNTEIASGIFKLELDSESNDYSFGSLFNGLNKLKSIVQMENVKTIDNEAFSGCSSLESISLPDGLEKIGDKAFMKCNSLTSVDIPESVSSLGSCLFTYCDKIKDVTFPSHITRLPDCTFEGCRNIGYYVVPDQFKELGNNAFAYSSISGVDLNNVESIGSKVFYSCSKLSSFKCEKLSLIPQEAFTNCNHLESISLGKGVSAISDYAFENCKSLKTVQMPDTMNRIGKYAFKMCNSITQITLPKAISKIEEGTFLQCTNLKDVTIPESVQAIGREAFSECKALKSVDLTNVKSIEYYSFYRCGLLKVVLAEGVNSVEMGVFQECATLTEVVLPSTIKELKYGAFLSCNISKLTIYAKEPPSFYVGEAFSSVDSFNPPTMDIFVPAESIEAYKAHSSWSGIAKSINPIM